MLSIGNITLASPLILAPMAGISDLSYRLLNRSLGCGLAFTEMIDAASISHKNKSTLKMIASSKEDRPLGIQLLAEDPELIKRALDIIPEGAFDIIDFNAACPVRKVVAKGKGAALLKEPLKLQELLKVIVENTTLPVTVKIRAGWDESTVNAVDIAHRAEDAGVKALTIHGRTRAQRYKGNVDYKIIRDVRAAVAIPVIASGDALSPQLIKKLFDETGCNGVAVARGALGNPWIFRETAELLNSGGLLPRPDVCEIVQTMKEHFALNMAFHGETTGVVNFRKFFSWYLRGLPAKQLKVRAFQATDPDEMVRLIDEVQLSERN